MSKMLCSTIQFRGEDGTEDDGHIVEVTDVQSGGVVEIALDVKRGTDRLYIQLPLHELVRLSMTFRDPEAE